MQVAAMQRWNTHEGIQVAGSRLLGRLSMDEGVVSLRLPPLAPSCIIAHHHHHHTTSSDKSGQLLPRPPPMIRWAWLQYETSHSALILQKRRLGREGVIPFFIQILRLNIRSEEVACSVQRSEPCLLKSVRHDLCTRSLFLA